MVVIVLEAVPVSVRGELSRWLLEPQAGVFVGGVSALVRDKLWEMCEQKCRKGSGTLLYRTVGEQGYGIRTFGKNRRSPVDFDGLSLICMSPTEVGK